MDKIKLSKKQKNILKERLKNKFNDLVAEKLKFLMARKRKQFNTMLTIEDLEEKYYTIVINDKKVHKPFYAVALDYDFLSDKFFEELGFEGGDLVWIVAEELFYAAKDYFKKKAKKK